MVCMCTAQSERHAYALYREERKESDVGGTETPRKEGESARGSGKEAEGREIEFEDEDEEDEEEEEEMEGQEGEEPEAEGTQQDEEGTRGQGEIEAVESSRESPISMGGGGVQNEESAVGEAEGMEVERQGEEELQEQRGGEMEWVRSVEEEEDWPSWLRSAVAMLRGGERGEEMESILVKFVGMERALGFKGEKTVSQRSAVKG